MGEKSPQRVANSDSYQTNLPLVTNSSPICGMAEAATRERLRLAAVAAGITLVALVGIISVIWVPAPTELTYTLVSDEDGNVGVQSLSQAAVEPAVQPLDGSYRLVNKCNLYGCRTIRVRVGESRKLEAEHEARLQAMKLEQDSKLKAQRNAMEVALRERQAATYSPAYLTTAMHKPQELAAAPHAQKAAAAIAHAFAKVDSENPQHKAGASQLVVKKQDKAAEAAKDKVARKPKDSLQAEAKQAMADSAAVKTRVEQEVAAIKVAAEAAEGKIKKEEHAEVKELKAADHRQQVHAAPVVAPPTATFKKAALPLQDGPKAAKFSEPVPSSAHSTAVKVAKPTAAAATPHKMVTKAEDKHVQQAAVQSKPVKRLHRADHAARAPKVANMMDGDQKPRAEAPAAVEAGYWKQSAPAAVSTPGGRNPGAAWGRKQHRSLSAAKGADLKLSQLPPKNGGYGSRRAEGRAVMRAPGPAVEPDFADRKVVVDRPPRQVRSGPAVSVVCARAHAHAREACCHVCNPCINVAMSAILVSMCM